MRCGLLHLGCTEAMGAQQAPALVNPALLPSSAVGQSRRKNAGIEHAPLADSGPAGTAIAIAV